MNLLMGFATAQTTHVAALSSTVHGIAQSAHPTPMRVARLSSTREQTEQVTVEASDPVSVSLLGPFSTFLLAGLVALVLVRRMFGDRHPADQRAQKSAKPNSEPLRTV